MPSAADSDEEVTRASEARMTAHRNLANAEASAIEQVEGPRAALVRRTVEAELGHRSAAVRQRTATALIEADQRSQARGKRARAANPEYNLLTTEEHMEPWRKGWIWDPRSMTYSWATPTQSYAAAHATRAAAGLATNDPDRVANAVRHNGMADGIVACS